MPPYRDDENDREDRPSWSEIDKMRQSSSHRTEEKPEAKISKEQAWVKQAAQKEAESLFDMKLKPQAQALLTKILESQGQPDFPGMVDKFLKKYGMPIRWRALLAFLDHPDPEIFEQVILTMKELYPGQSMTDRRAFKTKLSILSNTTKSGQVRMLVVKVQKSI
jgi:hypothetical protein